jgi:hypothetical protein
MTGSRSSAWGVPGSGSAGTVRPRI